MGKKLIINGADFSANALIEAKTKWVFGYTDSQMSNMINGTSLVSGYCTFDSRNNPVHYQELQGLIKKVKCSVNSVDSIITLTIYKESKTDATSRETIGTFSIPRNTPTGSILEFEFDSPQEVGSDSYLCIHFSASTPSAFAYITDASLNGGFKFNNQKNFSSLAIPFDFAVIDNS